MIFAEALGQVFDSALGAPLEKSASGKFPEALQAGPSVFLTEGPSMRIVPARRESSATADLRPSRVGLREASADQEFTTHKPLTFRFFDGRSPPGEGQIRVNAVST